MSVGLILNVLNELNKIILCESLEQAFQMLVIIYKQENTHEKLQQGLERRSPSIVGSIC
jgi:hypothetical protein